MFFDIDLDRLIVPAFAKIEFRLEFFPQLLNRVEFAPDFAAKSFQRPDTTVFKERFYFRSLKEPPGHGFPDH